MSPALGRVLFVCDRPEPDPAVASVAADLGYQVLRVRTAAEALAHAGPPGFALILAGYAGDLPALLAAVRELRAAWPQTPLVVLGLPVHSVPTLEAVYEAGAIAALDDPVSPIILKAKARFYLEAYDTAAERRRAEQELRRLADDLAEQDRLKTEFLATLAHELRNPLAPIRSGLQFLRRAPPGAAAVERVQDIMDRQLDHLVRLVDDLLDVARITRGKVELKPDWIDMAEVLRAAVETSRPLIEASAHRLEQRLPAAPLALYADPTRLTQIVSNLLNNAARYTPRGGHILLAAAREGEDAVITVRDDGIGIPSDALDEIFRMFTQAAHAGGRVTGGLGIGLSLVRRLVELHGGTVSAASPGQDGGSTFTVRLPLAGPGAPQRPPARAGGAPAGQTAAPLRVLVVDDNRDAAETLCALLGMLGHAAVLAGDGREALRTMAALRPQVAFLDIGMPGMSGHELARSVRADPQYDAVKLVALTGWGSAEDRARCLDAGFDAHLTKPATVTAIEEVLARLALPG